MQAVHIPLPIRQHRRWLSGIRAPELPGPWHERMVRSPWTYVLVSAICLYVGCLRGQYLLNFGTARETGGGAPSARLIAWYNATFAGLGILTVAVIAAGAAAVHLLRARARTAAVVATMILLAALSAIAYPAVVAGRRWSAVPIFTGLRGFGPYALYQLFLSWALLTSLAGFGLYLLLRRPFEGRRRWPRYLAALAIVAAAVALFVVVQQTMTAPLAIASPDIWLKVKQFAGYAAWTLLFWVVLFVLVDRWRPQRILLWFLALGWGACVATYVSMFLNTWIGGMMAVSTNGPGVAEAPAVYSAPFVEEAAKASVLFLIAIALRYRLTSRQSIFTLAGLSAAGFAFTENILYYVRGYAEAISDPTVADPDKEVLQLVLLRGVFTAFGHESFTAFTAIGLTAAVATRSKSVRILAPLAGYCTAAVLHMSFNASGSIFPGDGLRIRLGYLGIGIAAVTIMLAASALNWFRDGARIRARLTDYVRMGWLRPTDPGDYGRWWPRVVMLSRAVWSRRPSRFFATVSMIRSMTELAFLRDAMTRGIVNDAGLEREKELLAKIQALRSTAVTRPPQTVGGAVAPVSGPPAEWTNGYPGPDGHWGQIA